jgi:AraC family transcriptional regulator
MRRDHYRGGRVAGFRHREKQGEIKVYELTESRRVRTFHQGPYETCESACLALFSWVETHPLRIADPLRDIYPYDPREFRPEEIITEIMVPVL